MKTNIGVAFADLVSNNVTQDVSSCCIYGSEDRTGSVESLFAHRNQISEITNRTVW